MLRPLAAQVADRRPLSVGDLHTGRRTDGRRRAVVDHPREALRSPAERVEAGAQSLAGQLVVDLDLAVLERLERPVGFRRELGRGGSVILGAQQVVVVARRELGGAHQGPVGGALDAIADPGLGRVPPRHRGGLPARCVRHYAATPPPSGRRRAR